MKKAKIIIHAIGILAIILIYSSVSLFSPPEIAPIFLVSSFGFLVLLMLIFILAIPLLVRLNRKFIPLLINRRWIGIYTFFFGLIHMVFVLHFFFLWDIFTALQDTYRFLGFIAFLMLTAMAATSNDPAVRKLGRNWKRLHYLIYIVLILVLLHGFNLGQVFFKNQWLAWTVIIIGMSVWIVKIRMKMKRKSAATASQNAPAPNQPEAEEKK